MLGAVITFFRKHEVLNSLERHYAGGENRRWGHHRRLFRGGEGYPALRRGGAKHLEGVGGDAADAVVGGTHDELDPCGDGAEFTDDEPVPELRVIEQHVVSLKAMGPSSPPIPWW